MYRQLKIWQESLFLIKEIYRYADKLPKSEEYNLVSQLKRAATSVTLNIAEGKCRKTPKEFIRFLNIASASLSEAECILLICEYMEYTVVDDDVYKKIIVLNKQINSLIKTLSKKEGKYEQ